MDLYEKNGNILYILNVLKKYTDEDHLLSAVEIGRKVEEIYDVEIDPRTIRRNINLLKYKLEFDISTREENGKGYYLSRDPETDFEPGEVRAIIDNFSYANYIVPSVAKEICNILFIIFYIGTIKIILQNLFVFYELLQAFVQLKPPQHHIFLSNLYFLYHSLKLY